MIATLIAGIRRDTVLDLIEYNVPFGSVPTNADITECLETAMTLIGNPWVWTLAADLSRNAFAKRLSAIGPIDLLISDSVHTYCRSH